MAIDLASSSTLKEFNFTELCVAASSAYCSEFNLSEKPENKLSNNVEKTVRKSTCDVTLNDGRSHHPMKSLMTDAPNSEFDSSHTAENKSSNNVKKTGKKSTFALTLDDIRALPIKSLIDKFSEMTSDELAKKYSYKCLLLPDKCTMTFKSFGNERKACEKIKSHLICHVQQLILEQEASGSVSNLIFVPKSPTLSSRQTEKNSEKVINKHRSRLHLSKRTNSCPKGQILSQKNLFKASRKEKNHELNLKKLKGKLHSSRKHVPGMKNGVSKGKSKSHSSVYLHSSKNFFDDSYQYEQESMEWEKSGEKHAEDEEGELLSSNYNKHLKDIFFSSDAAKEKLSESDSEIYDVDLQKYLLRQCTAENSISFSYSSHFEQSYTFLQDHNYTSSEEVRDSKPPSATAVRYEDPLLLSFLGNAKNPLAIDTPAFPYVHIPLGLEHITQIVEIGEVECFCGAEECSRFRKDADEIEAYEPMSDSEEKYFYKMHGASSSVLEPVDNIVNNKPSSSYVPKSESPVNENDENVNTQKHIREVALMHIANLHARGKKKITGDLTCLICRDKKIFTAFATLIHHYRSHAGIKPYLCERCPAKFTRQHSLNYHMLIHENRSRFTCGYCGRTFRHPSHYKEHLRRHTGETPFHCTECNQHFKTRNTFKRHLKTRHRQLLTARGIKDMIG